MLRNPTHVRFDRVKTGYLPDLQTQILATFDRPRVERKVLPQLLLRIDLGQAMVMGTEILVYLVR